MKTFKTKPSPITVAACDPGDETQRNFRYQHAYGVILLIGAACKKLAYISLYAEHHEDFLCEREDGKFDGYQIKTRKPEEGSWDLSDEPLRKSIKRFAELYQKFGDYIGDLLFVSNADFTKPNIDGKDITKIRRSPIRFKEHIAKCTSQSEIADPFTETFQELLNYCGCLSYILWEVLKKVGFVIGPGRSSFEAEICAEHLPRLKECAAHPIVLLNEIRDELIHKVANASSLKIDDPSKHWHPVNSFAEDNPIIKAKRLSVDEFMRTVTDKTAPPFRYGNTHSTLNLGACKGTLATLRKKMIKGDLALQVETMERRSLSAEQKLIESALRNPSMFDSFLNQLVSIVKGECDEAYHHASLSGKTIGPQMLDDVYNRLKDKAHNHSALVLREPYETLVGIAGLLTGECKVWWSEPFEIVGAG